MDSEIRMPRCLSGYTLESLPPWWLSRNVFTSSHTSYTSVLCHALQVHQQKRSMVASLSGGSCVDWKRNLEDCPKWMEHGCVLCLCHAETTGYLVWYPFQLFLPGMDIRWGGNMQKMVLGNSQGNEWLFFCVEYHTDQTWVFILGHKRALQFFFFQNTLSV